MSAKRCGGFQILSHSQFYPIPYNVWRLLFSESSTQQIMDDTKDSFGVYIWNKLSKNMRVTAGSQQPYSLVAARKCPRMIGACEG
jgi:hypothetical protein